MAMKLTYVNVGYGEAMLLAVQPDYVKIDDRK